jgi:hypothetical protein
MCERDLPRARCPAQGFVAHALPRAVAGARPCPIHRDAAAVGVFTAGKGKHPMNIPEFATVLTAVMRHNLRLYEEGASLKDYLVPMAWGDPGLGKSDIAETVAADLRWKMVYADLATRDPAELAGMPWVEDGRTIRCRPDWLPTAGSGILFLDELPQAGIANLNIAATLIREHRIGEHLLPPTWMVACAGNHQHNRAGTTTMPSHVRNRLLHLTIDADASAWAQWASARGINPMLIAYNRYRAQEFHHKFSTTENAYPTPRSWTASHQVLRLELPEELRRECTDGMVGSGAGADFAGFCEIYARLPDVDAIIADPDQGVVPTDPMTSYALMGALSYRATAANLPAIVRYLARLPEQEFAVVCIVDATARNRDLMNTSTYQSWAAAHGDLLSGH